MLTTRTKVVDYQRCPRARWWLYESPNGPDQATGLDLVRQAIPLVTGGAIHAGLASLLMSQPVDVAVASAIGEYNARVSDRGFQVEELEDSSWIYKEQLALTEGLVRLAAALVLPKLLAAYEVLEVEKPDFTQLYSDSDLEVGWRSIPDALLRSRAISYGYGDLYQLSWKSCSEFSPKKDDDARTDTQGLSEAWGYEATHLGAKVRGTQMVYLVKGSRRKSDPDPTTGEVRYVTQSPLTQGWWNGDSLAPQYATSYYWRCTEPHPMRKSAWYPTGECAGQGKRHERGSGWKSFPVWEQMEVKDWLDRLLADPISATELETLYALPVPHYRTDSDKAHWLAQTRAQEIRVAQASQTARTLTDSVHELTLDEWFPQTREKCANWFGRRCPAWDLCHGPAHVAQDPLGSGLYQIRQPWREVAE